MSAALAAYGGAHLALALGWLGFRAWLAVVERVPAWRGGVPWRFRALVGRALVLAALAAWPVTALLPRHGAPAEATLFARRIERLAAPAPAAPGPAPANALPAAPARPLPGVFAAILAAAAAELLLLARGLVALRRVLRTALPCRTSGRLTLLAHAGTAVPFAVRTPRRALIVVPAAMFADPLALRIALRHEGQHHRHGDTAWALLLAAAPLFFPLNPSVRLWRRTLQDLHEVACDEALVGRRRLDAKAYGHGLLAVAAGAAAARRSSLPGTAGMGRSQPRLERRLALFARHQRARRGARPALFALSLSATVAAGLFSLAYAAQGARPHDPLTMEEARSLVAGSGADFPVAMNELVLARLNKIITDPGRALSVRESLQRMAEHKPMIERRLKEERLPLALLAIPLVESGYQNLGPNAPVKAPKGVVPGAGLWMFIKQTARRYGLKVGQHVDERLDVARETDAALRLLRDGRLKYDDWLLSLANYNQGGNAVDDAIAKAGTRDAWRLVEAGALNDYLVYVTAGVVLIDHPELVE